MQVTVEKASSAQVPSKPKKVMPDKISVPFGKDTDEEEETETLSSKVIVCKLLVTF